MNDSITREKTFEHSIDKVWKAITNAEELSTWFVNADFKPEIGYNYKFKALGEEECPLITGEVKKATPYTLVYTWEVENTNVQTLVSWELEEVNGQTKLTLVHSGISQYPGDTAVKMFNSFKGGWENCMKGLEQFLVGELNEA